MDQRQSRSLAPRLRRAWAALFVGLAAAAAPALAQPIRIGIVNAQSGPAAELGNFLLAGAKAVFDEVNARGGVHGRRIELEVRDDGYEPEQTVLETLQLVQDKSVVALFGYVGTPTVNAVLPLVAEFEVPLIGAYTGAMSLRRPLLRHVFNVRASYDDETEALVARLVRDGAGTIAVLNQNDGFGAAVLSGTERALRQRGRSVFGSAAFQRNTVAVQRALDRMLALQPDAIVMAGPYAPLAEFMTRARAAGLRSRFASVSFVGTNSLVERAGTSAEGMLISQVVPHPQDSGAAIADECRQLLIRQGHGATLGFAALEGCISARVLVRGIELSDPKVSRDDLIKGLEKLPRQDFGGVNLGFSVQDRQASSSVFMTEVRSGQARALF